MVVELPRPGQRELTLHHEAIPDFVNSAGKVVGMDSMAMPFPVADPQQLEGLAVGDKIAFELEVRWQADDLVLIRHLTRLPPETPLEFDRPAPPAAESVTPSRTHAH